MSLGGGEGVLLPVLHDVTERQSQVFFNTPQHKVLRVEVHECVEEDVRRVRAQLLRLPQMLLLDSTHNQTCMYTRAELLKNRPKPCRVLYDVM